ncbi:MULTISPECIES: terminase large subunit domain-containing protein [unclassified Campylobacter]|uniref:terminase large subunit domain-containing protein n=1 Tax=unclassified Campylobacter TaxID=2593542 RepID=UPI001237A985|nr:MULTISPECIES: terminase family protein [unclassified Campylobacter]KAA6225924.1 hypothetical protein FMM57_06885 [Campylobacter sp. LR286c]KAA6228188.1 hypothetical protein FMM54_01175 [Campylobacter sp. LR185c]KAA8603355.1 hypothetical protein CGP82_07850 [Campylobacter sp. LR185c]
MDKQLIQKELILREYARRDFKTFLVLKWQRYNKADFLDNWHFDYLAKILSLTLKDFAFKQGLKPFTRLMINMPPSYGKTETIARSFIAWALGQDRSRKIIYISYSDELCRKISNQIRDLIKSSFWQSVFKEKPIFLQDNSSEFILKEGGGLFVTTLKSALTGFHANSIFIDDPIKVSEISSKSARDSVNNNFKESVLSRLQDNFSNITILMQRLSDNDLCGFLQNEKYFEKSVIDTWKIIKLEALNKKEEIYQILDFKKIRKANEPLFEKRHNLQELNDLKKQMGEDEFSTQYQQEVQVSEAGYFEEINFKIIPSYELGPCNDYIFVDNAMSLKTSADNRAITCIGVEKKGDLERFVIKDCLYGVFSEEQTIEKIISLLLKYPKATLFIESEGGGITLHRLLLKEIIRINEKLKKEKKEIIINEIKLYNASRKISKVEKIKAIRPYYNLGNLVFLNTASGLNQIKKELLAFNPEKPFRKDDCIDTIASAIANEEVRPPFINESFFTQKNPRHRQTFNSAWRI